MANIYQQISSNKIRSGFILTLFIAFILVVAYIITVSFNLDNSLIIGAIAFSLISSLSGYFAGDKMVLSLNQAKPADKKNYFDFYTVVENLSQVNQTPVPKIYVIDSPAPNAFATGRDPQHAAVCATTGLLNKLNRTELEGVMAHELSHIKNYDTRLMTLVSVLVGSLSILINSATRYSFFSRNNRDNDRQGSGLLSIIGFGLIIFAPIIAQLIQLAISRRREFLADASAVKLTRQPKGLINALIKISSDPNQMQTASTATASLYINNPFKNNKLASLFSTHPPIEDRIKALSQML
ncbi:MAG TPA: M48 family metalloprotease [Candidatus Woesebacteria bacterium]|jgi:heat shock protein HtpX|nr:M48 family metalloprotease [Candidatus Woesebacteria bacterium]